MLQLHMLRQRYITIYGFRSAFVNTLDGDLHQAINPIGQYSSHLVRVANRNRRLCNQRR